jgi:hypothetical protein
MISKLISLAGRLLARSFNFLMLTCKNVTYIDLFVKHVNLKEASCLARRALSPTSRKTVYSPGW